MYLMDILKSFLVAHRYINIPKTIGHEILVNKQNTDRKLNVSYCSETEKLFFQEQSIKVSVDKLSLNQGVKLAQNGEKKTLRQILII